MIKLIKILKEIRILGGKKLIATKSRPDNPIMSSKSYRIKLNDKEEFTIHKHKNHSILYPSYNINSEKYKRIKEFVKSKVPFQEINNGLIVFFRILNKYIIFNNIEEIKISGPIKIQAYHIGFDKMYSAESYEFTINNYEYTSFYKNRNMIIPFEDYEDANDIINYFNNNGIKYEENPNNWHWEGIKLVVPLKYFNLNDKNTQNT